MTKVQLQKAIDREVAKLARQEENVEATRAMIEVLREQLRNAK